MSPVWFFIANPCTVSDWKDSKDWSKHEGHYNWGISRKSRDLNKLKEVKINDIILCYRACKKELIGCCRCTLSHYLGDVKNENLDPDFDNRVGISEISVFEKPIKLDKLKQMKFEFIDEYLSAPRGRSIVRVPRSNWDKFRDEFKDELKKIE